MSAKSISAENTFLEDTDDRPTLREALKEMATDVAQTLAKHENRRADGAGESALQRFHDVDPANPAGGTGDHSEGDLSTRAIPPRPGSFGEKPIAAAGHWRFHAGSSDAASAFPADMNALPAAKSGETPAHRELKRLALRWAQANGFRVAAAEVSLPNHRVRTDVAAYRAERVRETRRDEKRKTNRLVWKPKIGATAIFECKASPTDFIRDARSMKATLERLKSLHEKREKAEQELKLHYPSIRNGDSLFQEYETLNFARPGYERYEKIIGELRRLSARLHGNTKFDRLTKYGAANLFMWLPSPASFRDTACRVAGDCWNGKERDWR